MSKCLVLFVEGDTEVEFYKQVIANARKLRPNGMFDTNIECKSINGVGGFKNIVLRKFVKEIKTKYDKIVYLLLFYAGILMCLNCHRNHRLNGTK